jgi:hypothetical protein
MLLLVAGTIAGGCSRDAPLVAPELELTASGEAAALAAAPAGVRGSEVDDALRRLVPALGPSATPLRAVLLRLQANRNDQAARADLQRAFDAIASALPEEFRPDFDALRLELGTDTPQ